MNFFVTEIYWSKIITQHFTGSGGGGYSGGGGDLITQEDTIFFFWMDPEATEMDIETHFGAIGIIKVIFVFFNLLIYYVLKVSLHYHTLYNTRVIFSP